MCVFYKNRACLSSLCSKHMYLLGTVPLGDRTNAYANNESNSTVLLCVPYCRAEHVCFLSSRMCVLASVVVSKSLSSFPKADHYWPASETPYKCIFAGEPVWVLDCMLAGFEHEIEGSRIFHSLMHTYANRRQT